MDILKLNPKILIPGAVAIILVLAIGAYIYFNSGKGQNGASGDTQVAAREEVGRLILEVGKLIALPEGEEPTVATVTDVTKLTDQPFFQRAKNGDKVLIYTNAKKAILYDPLGKKVLDVAPINIGTQSAQIDQIKVVLRNGTSAIGLTNRIETQLKKVIATLNVVTKENAAKSDYEKTLVVVLTDQGKENAQIIARELNATLGELPEGENKPKDVDVLVIIGKESI